MKPELEGDELHCFEFKVKIFVTANNEESALMEASRRLLDGDFSSDSVERIN